MTGLVLLILMGDLSIMPFPKMKQRRVDVGKDWEKRGKEKL